MDTAAAIMDPIGTLVANGLRWLLDHIEPLKGWLDDLAGNAGEMQAFAATWSNVAGRMNELGVTAENRLADLDGLSGETVDADTAHVRGLSQQLSASRQWVDAVSTGLSMASSIVQLTHDLVRDAISQIVGMTVSSVSTTVITAGAGALAVAAQVSTRVSALLPRISKTIMTVVNALGKLRGLIDKLSALAGEALAALRRWTGGRRAAPSTIDMRPLSLSLGAVHLPSAVRLPKGSSHYHLREREGPQRCGARLSHRAHYQSRQAMGHGAPTWVGFPQAPSVGSRPWHLTRRVPQRAQRLAPLSSGAAEE